MRNKFIIILFNVLCSLNLFAGGVEFTANGPGRVAAGEAFEVTYTVTANPSGFTRPNFGGLRLLQGPSTMTSSSVQVINGRMSQSTSFSYTFVLQANSEGTFSIGPAEVVAGGHKYRSNSLTIKVAGHASAQRNRQSQRHNVDPFDDFFNDEPAPPTHKTSVKIGKNDIFVVVDVNKNSVYQGEHVVATIKVYTRINLRGFQNMKFPSYSGFYAQDIETPPQINLQQTVINGQVYGVGVIKKTILFPQRSGVITIDPYELTCIASVSTGGHSIFDIFGGEEKEIKRKVVSKPVKILVKPLPANKPASFSGGVGKISMSASVDKKTVKANDAITYKITLSGNGNLKLADPPKVNFPSDFESYDPKINMNIKNTQAGSNGTKTFEYLLIPRHEGDYKIAPVEFSYFDLGTHQYKTISAQGFNIHVDKGSGNAGGAFVSGSSKEDLKYINHDIFFIKNHDFEVYPKGALFFGSPLFWILLLCPLLACVILVLVLHKKLKENANMALMKNKKANKFAGKRLKLAAQYLKQNKSEQFYEEVLKAFWGYLSDKLTIPVSELSKDSAMAALTKLNIEQELIDRIMDMINTCEYARYAPAAEHSQMDTLYGEAIDIITKLQQKLR
ncbi:MAG: BatD family protein [Bacteroidota bacterium]|nr:BatD family protein [Bacteroidota bacterium]MDP4275494.1 BatD family protein [Bacteroidota bacterium]